jgi:arabinogalactan oligomer/maltooligosaccharide transport system permease protein
MTRKEVAKSMAIHAALVVVSVATLYPLLWVIKLSLEPGEGLLASLNPWPSHATLSNFRAVIGATDPHGRYLFGRQLLASVLVSTATTLIGVSLATTAAYALSRFIFPAKKLSMQILLIAQMFPAVLVSIPLYAILQRLGLLNSHLGLALIYSTSSLPFCVWMLKGYFDTIPKELEEAAAMDGASPLQILLRVVLPVARPALAVTALFSFMTAWNEFILAATFLNDAVLFTLPVGIQSYIGEYRAEWGKFAAGALIVSVPVMGLFFVLQRHLVSGLTAGSVKG